MSKLQSGGPRTHLLCSLQKVLKGLQLVTALALLGAVVMLLAGVAPGLLGAESFAVYSGSMEPTIQVGSLAVVQPVPVASLRPGDVVTYRSPARPDLAITHRLVSTSPGPQGLLQLRTRGDAVEIDDLVFVNPNGELGRVMYSIPLAGYLVEFTRQPTGQFLFLVLPTLLLLLDLGRGRLLARLPANVPWVRHRQERTGDRLASLVTSGTMALEAGDRAGAERAADAALSIAPRDEDAWLLKARATGNPDDQAALLTNALVLNPTAGRIAALLAHLRETGQVPTS